MLVAGAALIGIPSAVGGFMGLVAGGGLCLVPAAMAVETLHEASTLTKVLVVSTATVTGAAGGAALGAVVGGMYIPTLATRACISVVIKGKEVVGRLLFDKDKNTVTIDLSDENITEEELKTLSESTNQGVLIPRLDAFVSAWYDFTPKTALGGTRKRTRNIYAFYKWIDVTKQVDNMFILQHHTYSKEYRIILICIDDSLYIPIAKVNCEEDGIHLISALVAITGNSTRTDVENYFVLTTKRPSIRSIAKSLSIM